MEKITSLHTALPDTAANEPPRFVHLVPAGTSRGVDGRGPYILENADAVISASMAGGKLPIDEMHATDHGQTTGQAAPARGWIVGMQQRADGLWGEVEWTPSGKQLMADKSYRGISPVIAHTVGGQVLRVLRAGLTNVPNLALTSLHNQEGPMNLKALREALGLPETADEAAIIAAAIAARTAVSAHTAQLQSIAAAAGLTGAATGEAIITSLQSQRATAGDATRMAQELVSLQTQLTNVQNDRAKEKATAVIDAAITDGKPIPAVLRDHYISRHVTDPAGVEKELAAMISLHGAGVPKHILNGGGGGAGLTAVESSIAAAMNVDPAKMLSTRNNRLGSA